MPNIATMKPSSDLCFECQQNISLIMRSAHLTEDKTSERLVKAEQHLHVAKTECQWYNRQIEECKLEDNTTTMHFSFDYAQQLHYPSNLQQPGPLYFLTPRKCQLFEIACEPQGFQINYLIDEAESIGKGANATISLIHHFLESNAS